VGIEALPGNRASSLHNVQLLRKASESAAGRGLRHIRGSPGAGSPGLRAVRIRLRRYAGARSSSVERAGAEHVRAGDQGVEAGRGAASGVAGEGFVLAGPLLRFQCMERGQVRREAALHSSEPRLKRFRRAGWLRGRRIGCGAAFVIMQVARLEWLKLSRSGRRGCASGLEFFLR